MKELPHLLLLGLQQEEQDRFGSALVKHTYLPGQIIVHEGEFLDALCIVASGSVCVTCRDRCGREIELARLGSGEWFGEMSLLTGEPASASVRAKDAVEVWAFPRREFTALAETNPAVLEKLCGVLVERLRATNERYLQTQKAEVSLLLSPGEPAWAQALAHKTCHAIAAQASWRVALVDLSRQPDEASHRQKLCSLQQAASDPTSLPFGPTGDAAGGKGDCSGLIVFRGDPGTIPGDRLRQMVEVLREHYDHVQIYCGDEFDTARALLTTAALALVAVKEEDAASSGDLAANLPQSERGGRFRLVVVAETETMPTLGEMERLAAKLPLPLHCLVPGAAALEAAGREDRVPGATMQKINWLARDIAHLKVGLALGSGGSGGYAHVGVIEVLQGAGVPFDVVTGCSIGAAIAAGIAAGYSPEEIKEHVEAVGRKAMQPGLPLHSLLSNRGIIRELRNIIGERSFGDVTVPMGFVAADVFRGEEVVLRKGSAWRALVASMAIPGIYPPVLIGGRYLVDGGVVSPIPVSAALSMGADIVIGVKLVREGKKATARRYNRMLRSPSILQTITRALETMQGRIGDTSSCRADVTIEPKLKDTIGLLDFKRGPELVEAGERAAKEALPKLRAVMPWLK